MRSFEAFELVYCFVNKVQFCSFFFTLNCIAKPVLVFFKSVIKFLRFYLWFFSYLFTKFSKGTTKSPKIDWGSTQCPFNVEFRAAINFNFNFKKNQIQNCSSFLCSGNCLSPGWPLKILPQLLFQDFSCCWLWYRVHKLEEEKNWLKQFNWFNT